MSAGTMCFEDTGQDADLFYLVIPGAVANKKFQILESVKSRIWSNRIIFFIW